jgi:hypothetical protein
MTKSVSYLAQTVMSNSINNIRALQSFHIRPKSKSIHGLSAIRTFLVTLMDLINILIWDGNTRNLAPAWCDISALCNLSIGLFIVFTTNSIDFPNVLYHTGRECCFVHLYASRVDLITPQRRLKPKSSQAFRNRSLLCPTANQHTHPYVLAN